MTDHGITGTCAAGVTRQCMSTARAAPVGSTQPLTTAHRGALAFMLAIALTLSGALGGCAMTGAGAHVESPDIETLNARFRTLADEQLSFKLERSHPLSPPAQRAIEAFIMAGARRLHAEGATAQRIAAAETNLQRFVSRLTEAANLSEQRGITAATVEATRARLCPLYPFC